MKRPTQAVILAGGRGIRLAPITDSIPKPMIEFHGKPFLEYLISVCFGKEWVSTISFGIVKISERSILAVIIAPDKIIRIGVSANIVNSTVIPNTHSTEYATAPTTRRVIDVNNFLVFDIFCEPLI